MGSPYRVGHCDGMGLLAPPGGLATTKQCLRRLAVTTARLPSRHTAPVSGVQRIWAALDVRHAFPLPIHGAIQVS